MKVGIKKIKNIMDKDNKQNLCGNLFLLKILYEKAVVILDTICFPPVIVKDKPLNLLYVQILLEIEKVQADEKSTIQAFKAIIPPLYNNLIGNKDIDIDWESDKQYVQEFLGEIETMYQVKCQQKKYKIPQKIENLLKKTGKAIVNFSKKYHKPLNFDEFKTEEINTTLPTINISQKDERDFCWIENRSFILRQKNGELKTMTFQMGKEKEDVVFHTFQILFEHWHRFGHEKAIDRETIAQRLRAMGHQIDNLDVEVKNHIGNVSKKINESLLTDNILIHFDKRKEIKGHRVHINLT